MMRVIDLLCILLASSAIPIVSLAFPSAATTITRRRLTEGRAVSLAQPLSNIGNQPQQPSLSRRRFASFLPTILGLVSVVAATSRPANAAPPIAIIAEELGYFPVQNKQGDVVYVSKRVTRESSKQAVALAKKLSDQGVYMAGTYWCPHTSRQKELFGREAWSMIKYIECSSKGYGSQPKLCIEQKVDGYPTWIFPNGKQVSGERPLSVIANEVGFRGFREDLETNMPPTLGSQACR